MGSIPLKTERQLNVSAVLLVFSLGCGFTGVLSAHFFVNPTNFGLSKYTRISLHLHSLVPSVEISNLPAFLFSSPWSLFSTDSFWTSVAFGLSDDQRVLTAFVKLERRISVGQQEGHTKWVADGFMAGNVRH